MATRYVVFDSDLSVDMEKVIGTKLSSFKPPGTIVNGVMFIDLHLINGETLRVPIEFSAARKSEIEAHAGPYPNRDEYVTLSGDIGPRPRRKRFEAKEKFAERCQVWSDQYIAHRKQVKDYRRVQADYYHRRTEAAGNVAHEMYRNFLNRIGWHDDSLG